MGAGSGETRVKGGWGLIGQIATCNLNLRATLGATMRDKIKRKGRKEEMER